MFSDGRNDVGIYNGDFGLIEKSDVNLCKADIENPDDELDVKSFLLILDNTSDEVQGFIAGTEI